MNRLIVTSDWELTTERLSIAETILKELFSYVREEDSVVFCGDMFREFNAATVSFVKKIIGNEARAGYFLVGNHDREIGADRLSAAIGARNAVGAPAVFNLGSVWLAFLPAPDRAAFGASRAAEGRRARDAALSDALEAALVNLETRIGAGNLKRSILFFHGAVSSDELAPGLISSALSWNVSAARLSRWALAIGGHIHTPSRHGNTWSVGGIANWTFSDRAEQFRALTIDLDTLDVGEILLPRELVPIELFVEELEGVTGIVASDGFHPAGGDLPRAIAMHLARSCRLANGDTLALKLHLKLPHEKLVEVPDAERLEGDILEALTRELVRGVRINRLTVSREPTGLSKVRLESEDARKLSLEELFREFQRVNNRALANEVEAEVSRGLVELEESYRPGDGNLGFRPLVLRLANFRQWERAELRFDDLLGSIAITGDNATGKSNLLEAMLFALFKRSPSSADSIDRDLRLGTTSGSVTLEFETGGEHYLVRRALELGRGGVSCKSELFKLSGAMPSILTPVAETATEIDKEIERLVCSYELATATIWHMQRSLDRFVDSTPAEHARLFLEELSLDRFEPLRKACDERAVKLSKDSEQLDSRVKELDAQVSSDLEAIEAIPEEEWLTNEQRELEEKLRARERTHADLLADRARVTEKRLAAEKLSAQRLELERRIGAADFLIEKPIEEIGAEPEVPELDAAALEAEALKLKAERDELFKRETAAHAALGVQIGRVKGFELLQVSCEATIEQLRSQLAEFKMSQSRLELPACHDTLDHGSAGAPLRDGCAAWHYYSKSDRGAELEAQLNDATQRRLAHIANVSAGTRYQNELNDMLEEVKRAISESAPVLASIELQLGNRRNAEHARELWRAKQKTVAALAEAREAKRAERAKLALELEAIRSEMLKAEELHGRLFSISVAVESAEAELQDLRQQLQKVSGTLARRAFKLEALETHRARRKELGAAISSNEPKIEAWLVLASAMHRSGIPYLLMEKMIGSFEREANEILAPASISLQVATVSATKKGEARDRITILFSDERGQHPLAQASGAQRTYIGLAGTAALSHVSALFWGAKPELFVQDEGWDRIHVSRHDIAREIIAKIAERFTRFIYITHVDALADSADIRLRVVSRDGRSELL